ncbi:MAG: hypothetical protein R3232_03935 [Clostridia bacterium]|nr:hypothetical protein [Clostridia bacterium]
MHLETGFSKIDITPEFPTCLACSQQKDTLFQKIHDHIYARCALLKHGSKNILILSYDLLFHSRDLLAFAYDYASTLMKLGKSDIIINYTHNHNSPSTLGYNDFSASEPYEEFLRDKTVLAIDAALKQLVPCSMEYGIVSGNWNVNRRLHTSAGIMLAPNPGGPRDKDIYVLKFLSGNGEILGLLLNYACHPVHYPDTLALTSEYPGHLCGYLENDIPGCAALFIQGAGADTRPLGTVEGNRFVHRDFSYIENMAKSMEKAVIDSIDSGSFRKVKPDFDSINFKIEIPTEDEGREYFKNNMTNDNISGHLRRNAEYVYNNYDSINNSFSLECGIIKISDELLIAHMGGEPVCEVKFMIEKILAGYDVIFAGYTDACAYIVTDKMIDEDGYEVRCFLEYMHKGRISLGINSLLSKGFQSAIRKIIYS